MDIKNFLSGPRKIVVRTKQGEAFRGYVKSARWISRSSLRMTTPEDRELTLDFEQLKAIFFVREFEGDKSYFETKLLESDPEQKGLRVRLRFDDNETMEGVAENSLELLQAPGFFFWPADAGANNQLIYVIKSALLGFRVIGVKN